MTAIMISGDLGDVRVMAGRQRGPRQWEQKDWREWVLVGKGELRRRWRKPATLRLHVPVPIEPHERRCIYVHASSAGGGPHGLLCQGLYGSRTLRKNRHLKLLAGAVSFSRSACDGGVTMT